MIPKNLSRLRKYLSNLTRDFPAARQSILFAASLMYDVAHSPAGVYTLCYHHVGLNYQDMFSRQLDFFSRHGDFVSADRSIELLFSGEAASGRFFLVPLMTAMPIALTWLCRC